MTIIERIDVFRKSKTLTKIEFCNTIDMPLSSFTSALQRKSNISSDTLLRISNEYKEVSIEWLVTGNGTMMKTELVDEKLKACVDEKDKLLSMLLEQRDELNRLNKPKSTPYKNTESVEYSLNEPQNK